jgi:hypothetical protein
MIAVSISQMCSFLKIIILLKMKGSGVCVYRFQVFVDTSP